MTCFSKALKSGPNAGDIQKWLSKRAIFFQGFSVRSLLDLKTILVKDFNLKPPNVTVVCVEMNVHRSGT